MFSYVFMKILEGRPRSYDRGMRMLSAGRTLAIKREVAREIPPHSRVLEIGCGSGELAAMLVEAGCTVEGFDSSKGMVAVARTRIRDEGLRGRFDAKRMGVDGMDALPTAHFDAVVSTLVFSELGADARSFALKQAARVLRPGGRLVIADEVVPRDAARRLAHRLVRAPALAVTYLASGASTEPLRELAAEVGRAGFSIDREDRSHGDAFATVVAHLDGISEGAS